MKKTTYFFLGCLLLCGLSNAQNLTDKPSECAEIFREQINTGSPGLKFSRIQCFADANSTSALIFFSDIGQFGKDGILAQKVAVKYIDHNGRIIFLKDSAAEDQAGIQFLKSQFEFSDIDGDGVVDPIIVYRLYDVIKGASGFAEPDFDSFSGRIKIVVFNNEVKGVVRAKTGILDHERAITANSVFFTLPKIIQLHIRKKMELMYKDRIFGFDNSWEFSPGREK